MLASEVQYMYLEARTFTHSIYLKETEVGNAGRSFEAPVFKRKGSSQVRGGASKKGPASLQQSGELMRTYTF